MEQPIEWINGELDQVSEFVVVPEPERPRPVRELRRKLKTLPPTPPIRSIRIIMDLQLKWKDPLNTSVWLPSTQREYKNVLRLLGNGIF